jgi:hypothetical protein
MWTNKEFVAFKIATASKFGPNFSIFSPAQPTDVSFGSQFHSSRLAENLLPSKLPRTVNWIQICSFLRILNPTVLSFSLKFHLRGQIKILLPSKLPIFSTVQPTDFFFAANDTFHSKFSMFAYFKPNYSFFFIEISLM